MENQEKAVKINRYSLWQNRVFDILQISHPYMLIEEELESTRKFIVDRAKQAEDHYNSLLDDGIIPVQAEEDTKNTILLEGLRFSPTDYLASFIWQTFHKEVNVEDRVNIYKKVKAIFEDLHVSYTIYDDAEKEKVLTQKLASFFNENPQW